MATRIGILQPTAKGKSIGLKAEAKGCIAGKNIPDLDGLHPKMGSQSGKVDDMWCTLCGEKGHSARKHAGAMDQARDHLTAGEPPPKPGDPSGEAVEQRKQVEGSGVNTLVSNESIYTTGSKNYQLPGMRDKKGQWIFG